ncbi:MAG: outer membrane receptor protein [Piscirickettsiaceae bacterium]|nr:MAG: outer membrane receptor protein [Piscirickettsiaceae bacterium]
MSSLFNSIRQYLRYLLCLPLAVMTQQTQAIDLDEASLFDGSIPIVLSATRLAQPQTEAPATITIIDRALIKVSGAKNIPELFRLVPGMHVGYFRGNKPVVGYQGLNSEYPQGVQVLIDGRSVYSPLFGGVDWSNIPLVIEDIERIEIIRGANGSSFGSNAFQSVINITSSHAVQLDGFQVKSTLGERGYQRTLMRAGHSFGDVDFRLTGSHIDDNGYDNNDDDSRQDLLTGRLDVQLTPYDNLQINVGIVNSLKETRNPATQPDPYDPLRYVDESNHSIHARWEHSTDNSQQFVTQFSYTRHLIKDKVTSFFTTPIPGFNNVVTHIDYTNEYDRFDFEIEHQLEPSENTRLSWGIGLRNDRVKQPYLVGSTQKINNSIQRVFTNIEWRLSDNLLVNSGALWEHSQLSGDDLSPRLAINYLLTPYQSIRLLASRANRAPVLAENNFSTDISLNSLDVPGLVITQALLRSQSGLDAETVDSIELGYHGLFLHNTLTFDLKVFRNEYDNLIDERGQDTDAVVSSFGIPVATIDLGFEVRTFSNLHYVNVNGFEAELNYRPDNKNLFHAGYSYSHASVGRLSGLAFSAGKKNILFSIPKDTFNILVSHTFDNDIWASTAFYYTGSMEYLDSGNPQGPMRRLDFNAGKTFNVATRQNIDINLTLQLALDKNKDFLNEFNLDNRIFVEASYNFE